MPSRRNYLQGLMAVGGVGAFGMTRHARGAEHSFTSFVGRDETDLVVDGAPFYFNGANAPWLTHTYPSKETVDKVLAFADDQNIDVLRTGIHSVDVGGTVHSPEPGQLGEEAFRHVDYVVQEAEKRGIRLVFSLVDNWDYYGGMDAYVTRSSTASEHDDFFTDQQCRQWYREYVRKVLTRENTLTGRVYRDDPTILMWELANEAEAKSAGLDVLHEWCVDMAAHFKSIDSNHLLTTGSGGNYNTDSDLWLYSGGSGVDYVRNHQIPEIDVCSFHLYPEWSHSDTNEFGQQWIREHFEDAHEIIGKPAFLGEFGWAKGRDPSRPTVYADWFDVVDSVDGTGAAAWQLVRDDRSETSKHDIRPSDTGTTEVLAQFSSTQRSKRSTSSGGGSSGDGAAPTTSSLAGERLIVEGAGTDIWDQSDEFHFVHEPVGGDATLVARVTDQDATDPWAKAGVMLRDSLADDAAHAMMIVTPDNGASFQYRQQTGDWSSSAGGAGAVPQWVKIERRGDTLTGSVATDGESWTEVGSATIPMRDPHLGLAVTSHSAGTLSAARFENVSGSIDTLHASWTNDDVGPVNVAGSVRSADDATDDTREDTSVAVVTGEPTGVTDHSVTLSGELSTLGGADTAAVSFEWGELGAGFPNATASESVSSTGTVTVDVDGLESGTEYEFRAVATASDGDEAVGEAVSFATDAVEEETGSNAPTVDRFDVRDDSNPAWSRAAVDWAVADQDNDLRRVTVTLLLDGDRAESVHASANGSWTSGSDELRARNKRGSAATVRLRVTDTDGNETTATEQLPQ